LEIAAPEDHWWEISGAVYVFRSGDGSTIAAGVDREDSDATGIGGD
jgi:hypothetical protein